MTLKVQKEPGDRSRELGDRFKLKQILQTMIICVNKYIFNKKTSIKYPKQTYNYA